MSPELIKWLADNPWFAIVASLCSIVSLPLGIWGIVLYFKSKKDKLPCYSIRSSNLIKDVATKVTDVEMHFRGHGDPITTLTITRILFWNAGRETIKKNDVVKTRPITIRMKSGCIILSVPEAIYKSDEANNFQISRSQDKCSATLSFDHVSYNEGMVIQFFHTGMSNNDVEVDGKLMDVGTLIRVSSNDEHFERRRRLAPLMLLAGMLIYGVLGKVLMPLVTSDEHRQFALLELCFLLFMLSWFFFAINKIRKQKKFAVFHQPF